MTKINAEEVADRSTEMAKKIYDSIREHVEGKPLPDIVMALGFCMRSLIDQTINGIGERSGAGDGVKLNDGERLAMAVLVTLMTEKIIEDVLMTDPEAEFGMDDVRHIADLSRNECAPGVSNSHQNH